MDLRDGLLSTFWVLCSFFHFFAFQHFELYFLVCLLWTWKPNTLTSPPPAEWRIFFVDPTFDDFVSEFGWKRKSSSISHNCLVHKGRLQWKKKFSFGHCRMRGGVYPCPNFLALFQEVYFWSIKRVYFFKNANILNF